MNTFAPARGLGKAAPFVCCGPVRYVRHTGSKPMSVIFDAPDMG